MTRDEIVDLFSNASLLPFVQLYQRRTGIDLSPLIPTNTKTITDFIELDHNQLIKDFSEDQVDAYADFIASVQTIFNSLMNYHGFSPEDCVQ